MRGYTEAANKYAKEKGKTEPDWLRKQTVEDFTAGANAIEDELYHKTKYFIRCKRCNLTTPAYETVKEAAEAWENVCASVEDKMLISFYADKEDND